MFANLLAYVFSNIIDGDLYISQGRSERLKFVRTLYIMSYMYNIYKQSTRILHELFKTLPKAYNKRCSLEISEQLALK